jgi:hypothetical protein
MPQKVYLTWLFNGTVLALRFRLGREGVSWARHDGAKVKPVSASGARDASRDFFAAMSGKLTTGLR